MRKIEFSLQENVTDYIEKGLDELVNSHDKNHLKYATLNISQAIELALKLKLSHHYPDAIFSNKKKNKTIELNEAMKRIEDIGIIINEKHKASIFALRDLRNDYTHLTGKYNVKTLSMVISNCIDFLNVFLDTQLRISIRDIAKKENWEYILERIESIKMYELQKASVIIDRLTKSFFTVANYQGKSIVAECPLCLTDTMIIKNRMKVYPYWQGKCIICELSALLTQCQFCGKVIVDYGCSEVCYECGQYYGVQEFEPNRKRANIDDIKMRIDDQKEWYKADLMKNIKRITNNVLDFFCVFVIRILKNEEIN